MDVKLNDVEWAAIGAEEQAKITGIVSGFFKGARIVPDAGTAPSAQVGPPGIVPSFVCKLACNTAAAAAVIACGTLTGGFAIAVCTAAVATAREECLKQC